MSTCAIPLLSRQKKDMYIWFNQVFRIAEGRAVRCRTMEKEKISLSTEYHVDSIIVHNQTLAVAKTNGEVR